MLGRLMEMVTGGSKQPSVPANSYLGSCLDKVCPLYAKRYEAMRKADELPDALDVLALLVMESIQGGTADPAAARAFLSILIDNEHLPPGRQLNDNELGMLRELLMGYFSNSESVNERGVQVLSLIDKKFSGGEFSQARILLQIFDTSQETRLNNERNLFYEEMIMRLDMQAQKSRGIPQNIVAAALEPDATDASVIRAFGQLARDCTLRFHLYTIDLQEQASWHNALVTVPKQSQDYLFDYIPVMRWRQPGELDEPMMSQIGRHMTFEMLRRHVQMRLRMCYFLLLASGNTGFEWFIFAFTRWSRDHFDVDIREVFPMLHKCGIVDNMSMQEAIDVVIDRFYGPAMNRIVMTQDELNASYRKAVRFILTSNLNEIPPGDYSIGDFILDDLLPFEYENPMFAYRLFAIF